MNIQKLRELLEKEKNVDINDELEWELIFNDKIRILCENLEETINFISSCNEEEFDWVSNAFEDIVLHFKSADLLRVIKENSKKFPNLNISDEIIFAEKSLNF